MPKKILALSLAIGLVPAISAATTEDEKAYLEWVELLAAHTELATKTLLNKDYVPGSITVLSGKELENTGVRFLHQALAMSANIDVQVNHLGQQVLVVRGVGTPFSGGTGK
jgi:iron complex outermembrane receptor protein